MVQATQHEESGGSVPTGTVDDDLNDRENGVPTMFYVAASLGEKDFLDGESILVSAGTAWRNPGLNGAGEGFDIAVPDAQTLFVDSGGYQATVHFDDGYPYTPRELFEWAEAVGADYVAGMDWAAEKADVLAELKDDLDPDSVPDVPTRVEWTIEKQIEQAALYEAEPWSFEFVPVVQGYTVEDYRYCAWRLREAGIARTYMGVGSVCKRDDPDKILEVLSACKEELPGTEFHLFGATRRIWKDRRFWQESKFRSADTHAWQMKLPDGSWTQKKEDFEVAYRGFKSDIDDIRDTIAGQGSLSEFEGSQSPFAEVIEESKDGWTCGCGTEVPAYSTEFEPGCRSCDMTKLNRGVQTKSRLDQLNRPEDNHDTETEAATLGQFSQPRDSPVTQ